MDLKQITSEQIAELGCLCCKYKNSTAIFCKEELDCELAGGNSDNVLTVDDEKYIINNRDKGESKEMAIKVIDNRTETKHDNVNHPKHYECCSLECIDVMLVMFGAEHVAMYCIINAYKYLHRHKLKNGSEDIEKAKWYLLKHNDICSDFCIPLYSSYTEMWEIVRKCEDKTDGKQN